ncbi:MAG: histidine kinase N-terminal 7TM domain-containing protein [archaeon]
MSGAAQSLSIFFLIAATVHGGVAWFGFQNREKPGGRGFTISMAAASLWTVVIAVNIYPRTVLPLYVSMTLRNGMILAIVLGWALLAIEYVRRERLSFSPLQAGLLLAIPVLTVILTATNPLHYLAIGPSTPDSVGGGPMIDWGPWHLVFMAYAFTVSVLPAGALVRDYQRAHGVHRRQIQLLLAGFFVGFLGVNDYLLTGALADIPTFVRISPFAFVLTGGFWSLALFRQQLFGIIPISRETVVETVSDPVLAVDDSDVVVDINTAAAELFGTTTEAAVGTDVETLCQGVPEICDYIGERARNVDVRVGDGDGQRHFSMLTEPVREEGRGSVVMLRDVTDLKEYERELEEQRDNLEILNQVLRHDVRNDLQLVTAYASLLGDTCETEEAKGHITTIAESAEHAVELTETAREMADVMLSDSAETQQIGLKTTLENEVSEVQSSYPESAITYATPIPSVRITATEMLSSVFRNLLKNAIQHNDKEVAEVTISATEQDETVTVRIADNGPGIPDDQKETIFGKGEKGLDSAGTGMGLFLVETLVTGYNGDIWVEDNDPDGSVFVVELPITERDG